jgi:hyperosmotically inducible protein
MPLALLLSLMLTSAAGSAQPQAKPDQNPTTGSAGNHLKDSWVTLKIHAGFIPETSLENTDIDVETRSGAVTLHGTVPSQTAKDRAAAIANGIDGVRSVKDNLRVSRGSAAGRMRDGWLKSKIAAQLVAEQTLDNSDIDIDVGRGAVELTGAVSSEAARRRAEAIAQATEGVKSVRNNLKVSAPAY